MDRNQFEKNWDLFKGKIKDRWDRLTDEDIREIHGNYFQLINKLQKRYGHARERIEKEIGDWMPGVEKQQWEEEEFADESPTWEERGRDIEEPPQKRKWDEEDWKKKRKAG